MAASPSPSPDDDQVAIGSVLDGRYRIDAVLGSGGMGRVYRGEHTGIGRAVAIKVLHADLNRNREAAARFQREALASGRLDHPNIVGVSDFGVLDDGACFLVMEALEGESLGDRLDRDKRMPWPEALAILRGVLAGLRHAHERGVVHRDIKPDNIFLARKGNELVVKILDFGIAKLAAGSGDDPASTRAGLTVGTPAYLSPEQAVGGAITPASDIYSATIVLVEMITGRTPFDDKEPLAMLGAHVSRPPPALATLAPELDLPADLEDLVQRGLVKTSADRIASCDDYLRWVDAILATAPKAEGSAPVVRLSSQIGSQPTQSLTTPPPLTPPPGTLSPLSLSNATPSGGYVQSLPPSGTGFTEMLDALEMKPEPAPTDAKKAQRAVSLADAPPLPRRYFVIGAVVLAVAVVVAIIAIASSGSKREEPAKPEPAKPDKPAIVPDKKPAAATVPKPPPPPAEPTFDAEAKKLELKALIYELEKGKDCATRKAAIPKIVELGDPSAIPALKKARYRMYGGILGFGQDNANACLTRDAEAAMKKLAPPAPTKK